MNTQNVNTAAQEPSERWGEGQAASGIEKCLILSTAHMTEDDSGLFYWLARRSEKGDGAWMWIHDTGYGHLICLDTDGDRLRWLRNQGISESLCYLLETVSRLAGMSAGLPWPLTHVLEDSEAATLTFCVCMLVLLSGG